MPKNTIEEFLEMDMINVADGFSKDDYTTEIDDEKRLANSVTKL